MRRSIVVLTLAAALTAPCALAAGASRPAGSHHRPALRPFSGCAQLMAYVRRPALALGGSATRTLGALALPDGDHQLLRDGTRIVVITRAFGPPPEVLPPTAPAPAGAPRPAMAPMLVPSAESVVLTEVDAGDPAGL